jgi:DNA-binding winged helix-turn-helix (wHTH) protein/predicted ATPase
VTSEQRMFFSPFWLDVLNQQLWRGEDPLPLRPKTFAVLRYLVDHAGRLVAREELIKAVWPDTHGAEKGPKRCILELRAALGDRVGDPRFIETVGRRGYRFIAPLTTVQPGPNSKSQVSSLKSQASSLKSEPVPSLRPPAPILVGREPELAQLHRWLDKALNGERQVVFVSGEPGIGKTTLVSAFLHSLESSVQRLASDDIYRHPSDVRTLDSRPQTLDASVWIGRGQCIEHYGEGEAYLPVLEALGRLAGKLENTLLLDLLRRHAPSWLAQLPALVSEGELGTLQRKLQGATRQRMLREIADVISALTTQVPLILVVEDLHWSDYSTLDFLSSVTQRREPGRLLLVGTYRSADMLASDHPLRAVVQELLSHGQACELPLAGLTLSAVEQYLDTCFPRHTFSARFANILHLRTEGNPLFLVNLVDELIDQGLVSQAEGRWTLRVTPETIAARVPENSRRLIEKQMARLAPETQRLLEAASMAGVEFDAAAVASALEMNTERVEEQCDRLVRQELFLRRMGVDEWPDGTQTARYGFLHAVYQQLWSEQVPAQRQQRFHLRIGERQEQSYAGRVGEIAAELAVHFGEGRDYRRAVQYRWRAALNALQRSAHRETIDHLTKGLELFKTLPDTPERTQQELRLQLVLGVPLTATKGYAAPEVARVYSRALELCQQVRETSQTVQALLGLWVFYFVRAELQTAHRLGERCLHQAQSVQAADLLLDAHNTLGDTLFWLGELVSAREHLEQSLALHDPQQHHSYVFYDVTDPGVACLCHLAWTLWFLGYPDQALKRSHEALALAQGLSHPYSLSFALNFAAALHCCCREERLTQERAEAAMALSTEQGFPLWLAMGTILRGWALAERGQGEEGMAQIHQGLAAFQAIGAELGRSAFLALLAEAYGEIGQAEEGLRVLAEALAVTDKNSERLYEAEIHRLKGELSLQLRQVRTSQSKSKVTNPQSEAEVCFHKAIETARRQQAKALELRAVMSLARLWQRQGKKAAARRMLEEIYGWFTEGFDTADLKEAKDLLGELS